MVKLTGTITIEGEPDKHELSEARYQASSLSIKLGSHVDLVQLESPTQSFYKMIAAFEQGEEVPLPEDIAELPPDTVREQTQTLPIE